ncbi:AraC family transcriptional regulator [Litoreibacter janthinus]|uniref:Transcriptional regulator, AraC family n=1 Tax=Litoreibacter janthinus TaxID=670154 RepID=A0A1I6FQ69_9RHOB|nr:AraC family transcriptional regulator [Litoreibacter janthinus]SFR32066.1 transcriptional regulator, AraC family [Litoreibacter janthinus]
MANPYEARLLRVKEYIHDNPAGDLSLDALADVAAMSRFHWHRVFHGMTGETCAGAVRRIRMHRAACWLIQKDWSIAEVAKRCGYDNVRSFTRTFREVFTLTPVAFRTRGALLSPQMEPQRGDDAMYPVEIRTQPKGRLAALAHTGPYIEIGKKFEAVSSMFSSRGLWPHARGMAGIYYDDPNAVPEADLRSYAGILVGSEFDMPGDMEDLTIAEGKVAVLTYQGPYAGLKAAYDYLYGAWLPQSGEEPRDAPAMEVYLNDPTDTAPEDLLTEIYLPLN